MGKNAPRRAGFTLVEILTVAAIVGTLAALLMPSLGTAREKSRAAACLSNLRQLGQAMYVYQDEFNTLPTGPNSGYTLWNGTRYLLAGQVLPIAGHSLRRAFYCPSASTFLPNDPITGILNLGVANQFSAGSYVMRGLGDGAPRETGGQPVSLVADIFFAVGSARNHAGGVNTLYADGSAGYAMVPTSWNIGLPGSWGDLDR